MESAREADFYRKKQTQALYLQQKQLLDTFLHNGAITQAQYDKSLGDLTEKMGMQSLLQVRSSENQIFRTKQKEDFFMQNCLVAYFSATGVTAEKAWLLAKAAKAGLYEICPDTVYTSPDLNWMDPDSRSSVEMKDKSFRPAMADKNAPVADYDTIFLGFPIWWYVAPTIINTFLESYDFSGKKIILFATSGGSGFGQTVEGLRPSAPGAEIIEGRMLNGSVTENDLRSWLETL